ncbi:MAG: hypothetical protein QW063_02765 [Candidatus Nanoarchaeia archaeon]
MACSHHQDEVKSTLTQKKIKAELNKFATLDEKRQYLENLLKTIKVQKLRRKIQRLLDEILKQLKRETKSNKEALEQKFDAGISVAKEIEFAQFNIPARVEPRPIKYVLKPKEVEESALEKKVKIVAQPLKFTTPAELKYELNISYTRFWETVEQLRHYLSEHAKLVQKFTPTVLENLPYEQRKEIEEKVGRAFGVEDPERVKSYISAIFGIEKPEKKYKLK